ncbi:hypothetical protein B0T24DRAFT_523830 [Lasiosphaeria ovina]|uniref:Uncharacterized protein n=1 Tax=Lasiosphaeria ovina TaxID=92902 RepID=A0AAE0KHT0_9PEZI|nr:hypothetical protein B0T24DRAFT_523830 [Lasiosphaeria ovina]
MSGPAAGPAAAAGANQGGAEVPVFRSMPAEIQQRIFTEALRKPQVHFVKASRRDSTTTNTWSLLFRPFPRRTDPSGFRVLESLAVTSANAAAAVRLATLDYAWLPFAGLLARFDASTDVVCIEFDRTQHGFRFEFFNRRNWLVGDPFAGGHLADDFPSLRRVAFTYNYRGDDCMSGRNVFRCLSEMGRHRRLKICPEELVGLIDCLPSLEEVYIILKPSPSMRSRMQVLAYARAFFNCKYLIFSIRQIYLSSICAFYLP